MSVKQSLRQVVISDIDHAEKYYAILSAINNLQLTKREIQLVAFTAVNGNISSATAKNKFCKNYDTTIATINNIISKLKRRSIFVKKGRIVSINPIIVLDFNKNAILVISLEHGK